MESDKQRATLRPNSWEGSAAMERRSLPRFALETDICVYSHSREAVHGYTVDISEAGISAMLTIEIPIGAVVRLEFRVPAGPVEMMAIVQQRSAFRYGFLFIEAGEGREMVNRACRELAVEQTLAEG